MEMNTVLIGNRIREARRLRNISAEELCDHVGIAPQTLRHIESGANQTKLQTIINIADTLEVSVDYLLGRVASPMETLATDLRHTYGLSEYQGKMLHDVIEKVIPVITDYVEK